jgi:hypothetical protein
MELLQETQGPEEDDGASHFWVVSAGFVLLRSLGMVLSEWGGCGLSVVKSEGGACISGGWFLRRLRV